MQPWVTIARATAPDGAELVLARRGTEWVVRVAAHVLMSSRTHGSEEELAVQALPHDGSNRDILVGGLGLGFTLRAALDRLSPSSSVVVCELVPELVEWNRLHIAELATRPLDDPRVRVTICDVGAIIGESDGAFDAILLDVDNGPTAVAHASNHALYDEDGIAACRTALRPNGVLALWSAGPCGGYARRLRRAGFNAKEVSVRATRQGRAEHIIVVAIRA